MERDRQGIDPRFNSIPPPLDVYQFIWDRTRMIRKDFILQNFSGTGGKCNAIAVRCHERIARWHCMCEHQLSHIPQFITMQSQQNVQELGATMKTLNMYYDDADGRATKEDDDNDTSVTDSGLGPVHGCSSDTIMGKNPMDYDGKVLSNKISQHSISKRIIGRESISNGTAEPEMRGLYILLTINNDGGMEVLKYSARLLEQSPDIFNSKPVQLALQVYKAKREYNYARFFSILRSLSTPYLFSCIMFKYVEQMRKAAFRIMSKTFGARTKDGKPVYDEYPLQDLVHLLCFEDLDEAREACLHYNITIQSMQSSDGNNIDVILWRHSDFREKRDPKKGIVVNLKPKKMNRVIESKLNGATKLAICRGEVSGDGATLAKPTLRQSRRSSEKEFSSKMLERSESRRRKLEEERIQREKQIAEAKRIMEEKKAEEQRQRLQLEEKRKQMERLQKEKEAKEAKARAERERKELELWRQREEAERQRKLEEERIAALKREAEEKIILEHQRQREAAEKLRLQKEMELQRQLEEKRLAEERKRKEEEQRRLREIELRRQQEMEKHRLEMLRKQKEVEMRRLEEEKRLAEERRIELEWKSKLEMANKFLILSKWRANLSRRRNKRMSSSHLLERLDPTATKAFKVFNIGSLKDSSLQITTTPTPQRIMTYEELFYQLGTSNSPQFDLAQMMTDALDNNNLWKTFESKRFGHNEDSKTTILFKLGIHIPRGNLHNDENFQHLAAMIKFWVDSKVAIGTIHTHQNDFHCSDEVRILTTFIDEGTSSKILQEDLDAIMIIVPPTQAGVCLDSDFDMEDVLRLSIKLDDIESTYIEEFDDVLLEACEALFNKFLNLDMSREMVIERISLKKLCIELFLNLLWTIPNEAIQSNSFPLHVRPTMDDDGGDKLIGLFVDSINKLIDKISFLFGSNQSNWPAYEFATEDASGVEQEILDYFAPNEGLPMNWKDFVEKSSLLNVIASGNIFPSLDPSTKYEDFLGNILSQASPDVKGICGKLYQERQFRRSLEHALRWFEESDSWSKEYFIYLPLGLTKKIMEDIIESENSRAQQRLNNVLEEKLSRPLITASPIMGTTLSIQNEPCEEITNRTMLNNTARNNTSPTDEKLRDWQVQSSFNSSISSMVVVQKGPSRVKRKMNQSTFHDDIKKSKTFTANLKCLVEGGTLDMTIGNTYLSKILGNSTSPRN